jgi:hypothetical protein
MADPVGLVILRDAGGGDDRGVHQRAGLHPDVLLVELARQCKVDECRLDYQ